MGRAAYLKFLMKVNAILMDSWYGEGDSLVLDSNIF